MSRPPHHTEHRPKQVPNYAQAAKIQDPQLAQQQQQTRGGSQPSRQTNSDEHIKPGYHNNSNRQPASSSWRNYKNSYNKSRDYHNNNDYNYKKSSVQLPMTPNETAPIQFGSVNQPVTTNQRNSDIPVTKPEFGMINDTTNHYRPRPPRQEIPRSPRDTNDSRLFTQPYAPRRDYNQGDSSGAGGSGGNNGRYNNNRYHSNNPGYNRNNSYVRPPTSQTLPPPSTTQPPLATTTSPTTTTAETTTSPSHKAASSNENNTTTATITPITTPTSNSNPPHKPSQSPNAYHHHAQIAYSPQQIPQQPQNLPPSPMSHRASPNMNPYTPKKTSLSPHMPHSSPQSIQVTSAAWAPAGQYFYPHQYPVPVASFPVVAATNRSPIVPPPTTRKAIAIIDPATGTAVNTSPMSLSTSHPHPPHQKEEKHFDFKVPAVSKPVVIVDPAIRDRELREKKEREEAELEAKRKEEEEAAEKARKAKEEEIERERLAKEEEEKKRLQKEAEEQQEKERLEKEQIEKENERLAAAAAEAVERRRQEEEMHRKMEEENESRRVINELEADRKRQEEKKKQIKIIQDPSTIEYPPGIKAPANLQEGPQRHVYSIDFLLQFQQICFDTDDEVSAVIQRELSESNVGSSGRTGMGSSMRQPSDRGKNPPRTPGGTINLSPDTMFKTGSREGRMEMGKFNMGRPLTARTNSQYMERQGSMGRGGNMMNRGGRGGGSGGMKIIRNPPQQQQQQQQLNGAPFEPVVPLEKSENRWIPSVVGSQVAQPPAEGELMSQEYIVRKVNALLNKLTLEKFDTITPQIFEYARQSAKEDDGRSLHTVMQLVFEKACDEPAFANMWARLCHFMYNSMTDDIRDVTLLNEQKKPSSGVLLFRKYLFNRCQQEFEKGWKVNMPEVDEMDGVLSDEYYAAVKAKRQGLGLIQFIGELFKLDMLSERIMYNCMTKLCNDPRNAGDEEAESLCKLLTTIGKALDSRPKTTKWVDIIINRMETEMIHSPKLTSRVKFMIQDLLDLRKDNWVPRFASSQVGPTTIAKIHEMAEKAKEEKEAAAMKRNNTRGPYIPNNQYNNNNYNNMSRTGSYRNNKDSHFHHHNNSNGNTTSDGWSTVSQGGNSMGNNSNNKTRLNDLSNFGKMDRSRSKTSHLGPTHSPFAMLKKSSSNMDANRANDSRSSSPATNMFSALENGSEQPKERRRSQLTSNESESTSPKLSDEAVKRKSKNILEEYFNIRDKNELVECVKELDDPNYLVIFVGEMLNVVEKKAQDIQDMCDTIQYLSSEKLLEKDTLVSAFKSFMEGYDDLTIDVPQAPKHVAQLLAAASLSPEEVGGEEFSSLQNAYKAVVDSQA